MIYIIYIYIFSLAQHMLSLKMKEEVEEREIF